MRFPKWGIIGAALVASLESMFPSVALSKPHTLSQPVTLPKTLTLNCSQIVRADSALDPAGKLSVTTQIATSSNDAVTLVDKVIIDFKSLTMQVFEPGSTTPINLSTMSGTLQIGNDWAFGRFSYFTDPLTPGDTTSTLKIMKLVNIDRASGAFSTTRQTFDHAGVKLISYSQFVGICTPGAAALWPAQ